MTECSPRIAVKLARCKGIARRQVQLTMQEAAERGAGWTREDAAILLPRNIGWSLRYYPHNDYAAHRNYRTSLNA